MSYPQVYIWPTPDTQAVCLTQNIVSFFGGNLILNGHATINTLQPGNVIFPGISRTVSITSVNNLSGDNFTITGYLNGSVVTQTIAGPNNATVETTQLFDLVTSVSVNGNVDDVSIGTGTSGHTHWFSHDYNKAYPSVTIQVVVSGTITYSWNATLDNPNNVTPTTFTPITSLTAASGNELQSIAGTPLSFSNISIATTSSGSLTATIVEGGLTS